MHMRCCTRWLVIVGMLASLSGCYFMQAARGHLDLMRKREPIEDVLGSPESTDALVERLRLVEAAREFSVAELGLPDNDSYRSYADVGREYVIWNVFAAPEFSMRPKRWCYPIAGCVSYRGYFREAAARRAAERLRERGFDVYVGGVAAYSTLGKFSDPVLSTMLRWDDTELVAVLFHELAHQLVYVKGDSGFNESFASAVEEFGLERWLQHQGEQDALRIYRERRALRREIMRLVAAARRDLEAYFAESIDPDEKRLLKEDRLARLADDIRSLYKASGRDAPDWPAQLNNARIVSLTLYEGHLPSFRELLRRCNDDLDCFYDEARDLAALDSEERSRHLAELASGSAQANVTMIERRVRVNPSAYYRERCASCVGTGASTYGKTSRSRRASPVRRQ